MKLNELWRRVVVCSVGVVIGLGWVGAEWLGCGCWLNKIDASEIHPNKWQALCSGST